MPLKCEASRHLRGELTAMIPAKRTIADLTPRTFVGPDIFWQRFLHPPAGWHACP
ncbi:protein of unknown function [Aminobacter niigataensis]|nr:protein of unknown function [Aminobacter niigataensis]